MAEPKKDKIFVSGMFFEKPKEGAPEWIKGKISVKVAEFTQFANLHVKNSGYINIDLKKSGSTGKLYLELNDWTPSSEKSVEKENDPFDK